MLAVLVEAELLAGLDAALDVALDAALDAALDVALVAALDDAEVGLVVGDVCPVLVEVTGGAEDCVVLDVVPVPVPVDAPVVDWPGGVVVVADGLTVVVTEAGRVEVLVVVVGKVVRVVVFSLIQLAGRATRPVNKPVVVITAAPTARMAINAGSGK